MSNQANTLRFIYNGSTLRASPSSTFSRLIPELEKTVPEQGDRGPLVTRKVPLIKCCTLGSRSLAYAKPAEYLAEQVICCECAGNDAELLLRQSQLFGNQVQRCIFCACQLLLG